LGARECQRILRWHGYRTILAQLPLMALQCAMSHHPVETRLREVVENFSMQVQQFISKVRVFLCHIVYVLVFKYFGGRPPKPVGEQILCIINNIDNQAPLPGYRPATSWLHYTTSCKHSLLLLKMGVIITRNMLSWLELLLNRYCCI
jgi:hypothetical protein